MVLQYVCHLIYSIYLTYPTCVIFPKQFTVGVLNAVLSVSALAGVLCLPRWACLLSPNLSHLALSFTLAGVLCPPRWGAVSASLSLSPVSQFVSQFASHLSFTLAGVLCPPRWACLPICLPYRLCLSTWLGCCVRLARLVSGLVSQFVSHLALSFTLAGVLRPPRWACLPICLPSGSVFHMAGVLCPPRWACLPICLPSHLVLSFTLAGWCVRLALSFTLAGVLCPPRWACLPICLPSGFVFQLGWVLCPLRWACLPICLPSGFVFQFSLPICFPSGFVFHPGWGAVSASPGLSPVLSPNLSPIWLSFSLAICFPSGFVFHLGWGAVSASLGLSPNLFPTWLCLSPWLGCCVRHLGWWGCCVRLAGLVFGLVSQFVFYLALSPSFVSHLSPIWLCLSPWLGCCVRLAGLVSGLVLQFVAQFVFYLALSPSFVSPFVSHLALSFTLAGVLCPPRWACLRSPIWLCLPVLPPHFSPMSLGLSANLSPIWLCLSPLVSCLPICLPVFHLGWGAVSASLGLSPNLSSISALSFTLAR